MRYSLVGALALATVLFDQSAWPQTSSQETQRQFGGTYDLLEPPQRRLIDDWVRRFNEVTSKTVPPDVFYNLVRLSTRTTFDAVTHALMTSELTDASGQSLGTALDLVDHVETVHGKIKGAGGDEQFRIYVVLKPDAKEILGKCGEFSRKGDNTIFHKGYPLNYREGGGVPSIQISMARDSNRADIDVDYRSSGFPVALFNGHLSSSNSDVRSGNNHERHVNRWSGLQEWWAGLFGLPLGRRDDDEDVVVSEDLIPSEPPNARGNFQDAVHSFLDTWLVKDQPGIAVSYVSERAFDCLQLQEEETLDRGMAPFLLLKRMADLKDVLGPASSLEGVTVGVRLVDPSLRVIESPDHARFVLYEVAEDLATTFLCENRTEAATRASTSGSRTFGKYYGSTFYLQGPQRGATLALLWAKENGVWKIISYEVEPEGEDPNAPDLRPVERDETTEIQHTDGDPRLITVNDEFLRSWLIDKDIEKAFASVSSRAYACYNLLRSEDQPEALTAQEAGQNIRSGMEQVAREVPEASRLDEILEPIDPVNPAVLVVGQPNENAYTLVAAPDEIAQAFDCTARTRGEAFSSEGMEGHGYGNYFGTVFRFRVDQGEGAALVLAWVLENGEWKIFSYDVQTP